MKYYNLNISLTTGFKNSNYEEPIYNELFQTVNDLVFEPNKLQ
jgi:hypothetical protein